jgi:hypothetical protein
MIRRRARQTALAAALAAFAWGAAAQEPSAEIVKEQAGEWLVASDDGRPGCRVKLGTQKTIGGYVASAAPDCAAKVPRVANVAAWRFADGVTLADATRKPILVFGEDETTILKTRTGGPPAWYLTRAKQGVDRIPHASAVFGTWTMRRPNGPPLCTVTFSDKPPKAGEESYALTLDPACDPAIRKLKLGSWRIEDVSLMLYGEEDGLQFDAASFGFEKRREGGARPLHLVRQP